MGNGSAEAVHDSAERVRRAFRQQAQACQDLGSPFTATLCRLAAERLQPGSAVFDALLAWKGDPSGASDSLPLRFAGVLRALVLLDRDPALAAVYPPAVAEDDALWAAVATACRAHAAFLLDRLASPPQTNEVRRSAALMPGFLTIARRFSMPLVVSEVGASAGLNLIFDRYAYDFGGVPAGVGASPVRLAPDWKGPPPPAAKFEVAERAACDLMPLDMRQEADRLRLFSYIWADQEDRLSRTRDALALCVAAGVRVEKADAVEWLALRLADRRQGCVHVISHSVAWQYLPPSLAQAGEAVIAAAGARATPEAPLARLAMEADATGPGAALTLSIWPPGETHVIGRADFHGRWVHWTGWPGLDAAG